MTMETISYTYEEITYQAEWEFIDDDSIIVYLPNGPRQTSLQGLKPKIAAMTHLRAYATSEFKRQS